MCSTKSTSPFLMFSLIVIFCTLSPYLQTTVAVSFNPRKVVRINNTIPTHNSIQPSKPLFAHCFSSSDNLGNWTMAENDQREIHFRVDWTWSTLFYCDFYWGSRYRGLPVFDASHDLCIGERYVSWKVKTDGFYLKCGESSDGYLRHLYTWN
ncbi:unnamed protein product [Cuscuta campestris]|uniref:S-protein homolog n=1 Tax=Cuscuta campestris TaxID=132261 RepID=A0A484MGC2_9ASTE|nr:unnamed protein product [Cuscuta campestris]